MHRRVTFLEDPANPPPERKEENQQYGVRPRSRIKRRKRRLSNNSSLSEIFQDDPLVGCFMIVVVVVVILIVIALGVCFRLLYDRLFVAQDYFDMNLHIPPVGNEDTQDTFSVLPPSKIYKIPHSMTHIGDKSDAYATLRKEFEETHPYNPDRSLQFTNQMPRLNVNTVENPTYDIHDCPDHPPENYPHQWQTLELLNNWSPNDPTIPTKIYQGICIFDYRRDYVKALNYRKQEVPFVVRGDPEVAETVERWNSPEYLSKLLAMNNDVQHRVEFSESNQFMYWMLPKNNRRTLPPGWKKPTTLMRMTYNKWLDHANKTDASLLAPDRPHWYFRLIGCGETGPKGECDTGSSEFLFDELTFFQPRNNLYMVQPHKQRGIHCRFGMTGVTAENHFDQSRNAIVVLGGARRYILSHPNQCPNLYLYPKEHPSGRHSKVDWNDPDLDLYPDCKCNFGYHPSVTKLKVSPFPYYPY